MNWAVSDSERETLRRFGGLIRRVRVANNMNQSDLAAMLGVSYQSVNKIESGKNRPSLDKLIVMRRELNLSIDEMIDEATGSEPPSHDDAGKSIGELIQALLRVEDLFRTMRPEFRIKISKRRRMYQKKEELDGGVEPEEH